ncbi:MAG: CoA-binding protein [Pseudomonadota bacterium]
MGPEERKKLDRIFNPRGLALFGGINAGITFGHMFLLSQIRYGYRGAIYPISPKGGEIHGLKIYRSLDEVDGPVDLATVSVPAKAVPQVLRECLKHGLAGAQIQSSGFAELGDEEGLILHKEIVSLAGQGLRIIGPNCFGVHCPQGGITLLPGSDFAKEPGPVAFISQSGGVATSFGYECRYAGLGISKLVSYGNGADLEATELLEYLEEDPETKYVAAYLEGVRDARKFLQALGRLTPQKPVVIWKAGLTPLGGRAARSHTGSLAEGADIWAGALKQAGAVTVQGLDETIDALLALCYLKSRGRKVALVGGGGAAGVYGADLAHRLGLDLPVFGPETRRELSKLFSVPGTSFVNPLDTGTPVLPPEILQACVRKILTREPVDVLVLSLSLEAIEREIPMHMEVIGLPRPPQGSQLEALLDPLTQMKKETGKDVAVVFENRAYLLEDLEVEETARKMRARFLSEGIPVFFGLQRALRGIKHAFRYASITGRG